MTTVIVGDFVTFTIVIFTTSIIIAITITAKNYSTTINSCFTNRHFNHKTPYFKLSSRSMEPTRAVTVKITIVIINAIMLRFIFIVA